MPELILYLIKFNIGITAVYIFYLLFLRKLTFYYWNRYYLLAYTAICFLLPFLNITPLLHDSTVTNYNVLENLPSISYYQQSTNIVVSAASQIDYWFIVRLFLYSGFFLMTGRLVVQYISYRKIKTNARLIGDDPVQVYQVEREINPFSFGNSIFVNPSLHNEDELQEIIRHEFIHVKQKHSVDILFAELLCIIAWYNPAAWLIRHAIRQNLEFIADSQVLKYGTDRKKYQYMLLKVMGGAPIHIINPFNFSSLKKRISMMNKIKSSGIHLLKFLFILPLLVIMLLAFRQQSGSGLSSVAEIDTLPKKGKPAAKPKETVLYNKTDPKPKPVSMSDTKSVLFEIDKATVELKNGKKEVYYFKNDKERNEFLQKYQSLTGVQPTELASPVSDLAPITAKPITTAVKPSADVAGVSPQIAAVEEIGVAASSEKVSTTATAKNKPAKIATTSLANIEGEIATTSEVGSESITARAYDGPITVTGEKVFEITEDFTQEKLDKLVEDVKKKGYDLKVIKTDFKNGKLVMIEAEISKGADRRHLTAREFKKVVFTRVPRSESESGFQFEVIKGMLHVD